MTLTLGLEHCRKHLIVRVETVNCSAFGTDMTHRYTLVWLQGLRAPVPELWSQEYFELYRGRSEPLILSIRELTESERHKLLDVLARAYPPPSVR